MREKWIDNLKGILIILVVIGHILPPPYAVLSTPASYIFLFHMPAFFMISGYLTNPKKYSFTKNIWSKTKRLLGPYFFYLLFLAGTQLLVGYIINTNSYYLKINLKRFLMGGQDLNYFFCGALWFLTCSFFIYLFFYVIELLPKVWMRAILYIALWILAHYQSCNITPDQQATFWLWDVSIIGVVYFAIGHYFKKYIFDKRVFIGSIVCVATFLILHSFSLVPMWDEYGIELWSHTYKDPILDALLPVGIVVILANIVKFIPDGIFSNILSELGKYSLAIMAMHQMVILLLRDVFKLSSNVFLLTIIATLIPYLIVRFIWSNIPFIRKISF